MQLKDLQINIQKARDAYYNGIDSGIDDAVYDSWIEDLKKINPQDPLLDPSNIGAKAVSTLLQKASHKMFMGSLDNSMTEEDFNAFDKRVNGGPYYVNPKVDGASIALYYTGGKLDKAVTRGDGNVGDDITENVLKFKNLPKKVENFTGSIRGEAILYVKEWEEVDPDLESNPRNVGSGIIQRLDGENCHLMRVLAFDIYPDGYTIKTEEEKIQFLVKLGFEVPNGGVCKNASEVIQVHKQLSEKRKNLPYWIDGLVVKLNDVEKQNKLGWSGKRPKGQTAFKFKNEKTKTILEDVVWSVGHTGAQIPTAKLTPVKIEGTTVQNALLCNMDEIARLDIAIGDEVEVYKAGQIIPKIFQVVNRPSNRKTILEPLNCVACGAKTQRRLSSDGKTQGAVTECPNDNCSAKVLGKIKNFVTKVEILGLGDTIIEALVSNKLVKNISDLYKLDEQTLANIVVGNQIGEKRAKEIISEIDKKRELSIDLFLGSLGINHLGRRRVEIIRNNIKAKTGNSFDTIDEWLSGKLVDYKDIAGVPGVGDSIQNSINSYKDIINELLKEIKIINKQIVIKIGKLSGKSFCLTGTMSRKRTDIAKDIVNAGGFVCDDVTSKDIILVQSDPTSESSKSKKAKKVGANIISEDDLMRMI